MFFNLFRKKPKPAQKAPVRPVVPSVRSSGPISPSRRSERTDYVPDYPENPILDMTTHYFINGVDYIGRDYSQPATHTHNPSPTHFSEPSTTVSEPSWGSLNSDSSSGSDSSSSYDSGSSDSGSSDSGCSCD